MRSIRAGGARRHQSSPDRYRGRLRLIWLVPLAVVMVLGAVISSLNIISPLTLFQDSPIGPSSNAPAAPAPVDGTAGAGSAGGAVEAVARPPARDLATPGENTSASAAPDAVSANRTPDIKSSFPGLQPEAAIGRNVPDASDQDALSPTAIAGSVIDDHGRLAPGIEVSARPMALASGAAARESARHRVTDAAGMFTFEDLEPGEYELSVAESEAYHAARLRVRTGVSSAELRLQGKRPVTINGLVTDTGNTPLEAVQVRVLGAGPETRTDAAGHYRIEAKILKAAQPPVLEFQLPGFRDLRRRVEAALATDPPDIRLDVQMQREDQKLTLSGRVYNAEGEPVAGSRIWLSSAAPRVYQSTTSDAGGDYLFTGVEAGDAYRLGVEAGDGYAAFQSDQFPISAGRNAFYDIVLETVGWSGLAGVVTDPDGHPLGGFSLWLSSTGPGGATVPVTADSAGWFLLEGIPAGTVKFQTRSRPRLQATGIVLQPGQARQVQVPVDWGDGWLLGKVMDEQGRPVAGARIVLQWSGQFPDVTSTSLRESSSDVQGYFTFSNLGAGEYTLTVQAGGFATARMRYSPRSGHRELSITLRRTGSAGSAGGG